MFRSLRSAPPNHQLGYQPHVTRRAGGLDRGATPRIPACFTGDRRGRAFAKLAENGFGSLGVRLDERAHGSEVCFQCDEVLLGAVVQVALDPSSFGVGRGDHARSREAELVRPSAKFLERCLQVRVEPGVAKRKRDLTCQFGEDGVGLFVERLGVCRAVHDDQAEELPRVRHGGDAHVRVAPVAEQPRQPNGDSS